MSGDPRGLGDANVNLPAGSAAAPSTGPAAPTAGDAGAGSAWGAAGPELAGSASPRADGADPHGAASGRADGGDDGVAASPREHKDSSFLRELPVLVAIALLLALLIKAFLVQAFYIPSGSMEQTLLIGDRVLVNKLVYRFRDIRRGEIVVFDGRESSFQPEVFIPEPANPVERVVRAVQGAVGLGASGERDFIKRVVGLPGDVVFCCDEQGRVSVNGVALDEPYLYEDDQRPFGPVQVPEGRIFLMGDHRGASQDSRAYVANPDAGTVSLDRVIGRAFVVVWPLSDARVLQRPETFDEVPADPVAASTEPAPLERAASATAVPLVLGAAGAVPVRSAVRAVRPAGTRRVQRSGGASAASSRGGGWRRRAGVGGADAVPGADRDRP